MINIKKTRKDTIFLRFIAIILILNSHLKLYYPISYIGTGGAIGNSIFFMLASFGLFLSEKDKPKDLSKYYEKRIIRIYPSVWFVLILVLLPILIYTNKIGEHNLLSFLGYFFYPPYWFIQALMCYYFIGYFIIEKYSDRKAISVAAVLLISYIILYTTYIDLSTFSIEELPIDQFFYMGTFVFGIFLGSRNGEIKYNGISNIIISLFILLAIYGHKFLMFKGLYSQFQFIQQLLIFPLIFFLLKISRSPLVIDKLMDFPVLSSIIQWISASTLEIYLVHTELGRLKIYSHYDFPTNLLIFLLSTFIIVYIVNQMTPRIAILIERESTYKGTY